MAGVSPSRLVSVVPYDHQRYKDAALPLEARIDATLLTNVSYALVNRQAAMVASHFALQSVVTMVHRLPSQGFIPYFVVLVDLVNLDYLIDFYYPEVLVHSRYLALY